MKFLLFELGCHYSRDLWFLKGQAIFQVIDIVFLIITFSAEKLQVEILKRLTSEDFLAGFNYPIDKAKKVVFDKGTTKYGMNASECIILLLQRSKRLIF